MPENTKIAKPGDNLAVRIKLHFPLTISKGSRFALREGGKTIAAGVVTETLPDDTIINPSKHQQKKPEVAAQSTPEPAKTETKPATSPAKKADPKSAPKAESKAPAAKSTPAPKAPPAKPGATKTPPPPPPKPGATKTPPPPPPKGKVAPPPPPKKK